MTVEVRSAGVGGGEAEDEALREAAQRGNLNKVRRLLAAGANVHTKDVAGFTPLLVSAGNGHLELSRMLLGAGANVNDAANVGSTALHESAFHGHMEVCQMLVEVGADVHATTSLVQHRPFSSRD